MCTNLGSTHAPNYCIGFRHHTTALNLQETIPASSAGTQNGYKLRDHTSLRTPDHPDKRSTTLISPLSELSLLSLSSVFTELSDLKSENIDQSPGLKNMLHLLTIITLFKTWYQLNTHLFQGFRLWSIAVSQEAALAELHAPETEGSLHVQNT